LNGVGGERQPGLRHLSEEIKSAAFFETAAFRCFRGNSWLFEKRASRKLTPFPSFQEEN